MPAFLICALALLYCMASHLRSVAPAPALLARDLAWLQAAMPLCEYREARFTNDDVVRYYARTTFRDYRLLELATGTDAMHTRLPPENGQLLHVVCHAGSAKSVLEVGSGKGTNSVYLARLLPHVDFCAVDLVPEHVRFATRATSAANLRNVAFVHGDASALPPAAAGRRFDLIFGIESFCHLDTPAKMSGFMEAAAPLVASNRSGHRCTA